ncbi:hypothetical protein B0I35DRAFT_244790 [Stachybotrys elegans]|uniref:Uncharacterized protein n=1 Tax=Stachybotrys elegans TaxID=80388 RepID=A0A8K0SVD6_9HYPO|nr:hypothetical protein B0I35DRAFT_244790 [Stachybotrys elegans]
MLPYMAWRCLSQPVLFRRLILKWFLMSPPCGNGLSDPSVSECTRLDHGRYAARDENESHKMCTNRAREHRGSVYSCACGRTLKVLPCSARPGTGEVFLPLKAERVAGGGSACSEPG